jgi:hypothetical protein
MSGKPDLRAVRLPAGSEVGKGSGAAAARGAGAWSPTAARGRPRLLRLLSAEEHRSDEYPNRGADQRITRELRASTISLRDTVGDGRRFGTV